MTDDPRTLIREASSDDLDALLDLLAGGVLPGAATEVGDRAASASALSEIIASAHSDVLVAEVDGEVVGACQLIRIRHLQHSGGLCAELESMHVRADQRSKGIGGVLLEEAIERARAAGCYRIQLTSNLARSDAHRFYARAGFVPSHWGFKLLLG